MIVAHPRTGSSFFGDLFNKNTEAFFLYKPVDAVYAAMYGVEDGWTVPTDITIFVNGSRRFVSFENNEMI